MAARDYKGTNFYVILLRIKVSLAAFKVSSSRKIDLYIKVLE